MDDLPKLIDNRQHHIKDLVKLKMQHNSNFSKIISRNKNKNCLAKK